MITVTLFTDPTHTDDEKKIRAYLAKNMQRVPYQLVLIDITADPALEKAYKTRIPFLQIGPYHLSWPFSQQELTISLRAANDRQTSLEQTRVSSNKPPRNRPIVYGKSDRFSFWFSNHYMLVFNLLVGLYVGLAFIAPVFMKIGARGPARALYTLYGPFCHQLAYRSWFLFGEQPFYPRALAGIDGVLTYSQVTGNNEYDILHAKRFIGDETVGYKVALCERDVAIYAGILIFGLIFSISRHRIRPLPWYIWLLIGIVPIGLDGASQLPSLLSFLPAWLPLRESTPMLRTLTGILFGITTAWYGYPLVEESILDTRRILLQKRAIVEQISEAGHETR